MKQLLTVDTSVTINILNFADNLTPTQACWNFTHEMCKHFLEQMNLLVEEGK